jgi:hypothetical protein
MAKKQSLKNRLPHLLDKAGNMRLINPGDLGKLALGWQGGEYDPNGNFGFALAPLAHHVPDGPAFRVAHRFNLAREIPHFNVILIDVGFGLFAEFCAFVAVFAGQTQRQNAILARISSTDLPS